jgi:hypothetical protein
MARPQQPELARSAKTDIDPRHVETGLQGQPTPAPGGETGPIPPDNQPGHHPPKEQDKPDLDAFAAKLGTDPTAPTATAARKPPRPAETPAKATRTTPKKAPAKATSATPRKTAPPKTAPTPGKLPASAPTPDAVGMSAPAPKPEPGRGRDGGTTAEPRLVGLVLLPLRETVKRLEQLDRALTDRLSPRGSGRR